MMSDSKHLPVHPASEDPEIPETDSSCGTKAYVTYEEASLVRALKNMHDTAVAVRERLQATSDPGERGRLESELEKLRRDREALSTRREAAYRRKMVMLGHMPPSALVDEG